MSRRVQGVLFLGLSGLSFLAAGAVASRQTPPPPAPRDFRSFDVPPAPSPSPIAGLHDYAVPLRRPAPTATPSPSPSARATRVPAAGQALTGSGSGSIDPSHQLAGLASWHATGRSGAYAAACRPLRRAMGPGWRGQRVLVAMGRRAVEVTLNDWCGSRTKTIDLSDEAFRYFAPLSRGVLRVEVGW